MAKQTEFIIGEIVDETSRYGLKEVCEVCGVHAECVVEMVEAGVIEPHGDQPSTWRFSALTVMRSRKALRLQRDLEINIPGIAVTLDLLDEVEALRDQVKSLEQQLEKLQHYTKGQNG
jgi:chaperone modulatory protein CbpM